MDADAIETMLSAIDQGQDIELGAGRRVIVAPTNRQILDLSKYLPAAWIRQHVTLATAAAFCEYVHRFHTETTVIFADEPRAQYTAVLDYHAQRGPSECAHVAQYTCPASIDWKQWTSADGKMIGQVEFAEFIEANLRNIRKPAGADLLQLALQLQIHKSAEFKSEIRLDNGQTKLRYEETIRGSQNAGDLQIPSDIELTLPVFIDGASFEVKGRFKYRLTEGKLSMGYQLIRWQDVYNDAVKEVTASIKGKCPEIPVFIGNRG